MLILIPILLLLLLAVGLQLLGRSRRSIGSAWLMTAGSTLLVVIVVILLRVVGLKTISIDNWSPMGIGSDSLIFSLTATNWVFAFLLVSILAGVVFTDTIRLGQGDNLVAWTGSMVLTAVGLLSVYSQSMLAVVVAWTLIDIVEAGILIRVTGHLKVHAAIILETAIRFTGTALVLLASVLSAQFQRISEISEFSKGIFVLILFGAILRLGILPLHIPFTGNLPIRRSMGTLLRMVSPISVLAFLVQVQPQNQFPAIRTTFLVIGLIAALYGSIRWMSAKNELTGRPFWMLGMGGLALVLYITGNVKGILSLAILMGLGGGFLFLHSYSSRISRILGCLLLTFLAGFPFTPSSPIWSGLFASLGKIGGAVYLIAFGVLFAGFLTHLFRKSQVLPQKEMWMQLFYTLGLGFFLAIPWVVMIWQKNEVLISHDFLLPGISLVGGLGLFLLLRSRQWHSFLQRGIILRFTHEMESTGNALNTILKFEWFITFLQGIMHFLARPLNFFKTLLESNGGLLWAFLFLALISSVLIGDFLH